jgi:hypothetical protein
LLSSGWYGTWNEVWLVSDACVTGQHVTNMCFWSRLSVNYNHSNTSTRRPVLPTEMLSTDTEFHHRGESLRRSNKETR